MTEPKTISECIAALGGFLHPKHHRTSNRLECLKLGYLLKTLEIEVESYSDVKDCVLRLASSIAALYQAGDLHNPKAVIEQYSISANDHFSKLQELVIIHKLN